MYISPQLVAEIARSTAPQIISYVLPLSSQFPLHVMLMLTCTSYMTSLSKFCDDFKQMYNAPDPRCGLDHKTFDTTGSAYLFVLKSLFHDSVFSGEDCLLSAACFAGSENHKNETIRSSYMRWFYEAPTRDCTDSTKSQLFCNFGRISIRATIEGNSFCEKQKFKCQIDSVESFISKISVKNSQQSQNQARSEFLDNWFDYFSEIAKLL